MFDIKLKEDYKMTIPSYSNYAHNNMAKGYTAVAGLDMSSLVPDSLPFLCPGSNMPTFSL